MAEIPTNSNPISDKSYRTFKSSSTESRESQVAQTALKTGNSENTSSVRSAEPQLLFENPGPVCLAALGKRCWPIYNEPESIAITDTNDPKLRGLELQLLHWRREEESRGNSKGAKSASWRISGAYQSSASYLFLEGLGITSVPNAISSITWLRQLDLSNNTLEAVPLEVWTLTNLQGLRLNGNRLRFLSSKVENLRELQTLDLRDNSDLEELPWQLANLSGLAHLFVRRSNVPSDRFGLSVCGTKVPLERFNAIRVAIEGFHEGSTLETSPEYLQLWEKYSSEKPELTELLGQLPGPEKLAFSLLLDDFNKKYEFSTALEKIHIELQSRHCVEPVRKSARNVPESD